MTPHAPCHFPALSPSPCPSPKTGSRPAATTRAWAFALAALFILVGCAGKTPDVLDALAAAQGDPSQFRFVVLGDTQFNNEPTFEAIVQEVALLKPDLVLHVGDMIHGYTYDPGGARRQWTKFFDRIAPLEGIPFLPTPGNHDITTLEIEPVYAEVWGRDPLHFAYQHQNAHFLVLNTVDPRRPYYLSADQRKWLAAELEARRDAEAIFLSMHMPMHLQSDEDVEAGGFDWRPVHEMLTRYPVRAVFTGHSHVYDHRIVDGIRYFCLNSSGRMVYPSHHLLGWSHHYLFATVEGSSVDYAVVVPGDGMYPTDAVVPEERDRAARWLQEEQTILVPDPAKGAFSTTVELPIHNRTEATRNYTLHWRTDDYRWNFGTQGMNFTLQPGASRTLRMNVRGPFGELKRHEYPRIELVSPYVTLTGAETTATNVWRLFSPPEAIAMRRVLPIELDGRLDDEAWTFAQPITRMEIDMEGTPAPELNQIRILYDDTHLYVGIVGEEPNPAGLADFAHGALPLVFGDDDFELYLDPARDLQSIYRLMVNPKGTTFDSTPRGRFTLDFEVATHIGSRSWSAEFRIPYDQIDTTPPTPGTLWGLNIRRHRQQADPPQRDWSKMVNFPPQPPYYGLLRFQ